MSDQSGQLRPGGIVPGGLMLAYLMPGEQIPETCTGCGRVYAWPHLCREHRLCGLCHPPIPAGDDG
jgi:hypothetical protein